MEVQAEIEEVARAIEAVRSGAISPEEFRRVRVIQGIYPIRGGTDRFLLRIRIPLGRPSPFHLRAIADAADRFASGRPVHLTTRQDVHIYDIGIRDIPEAMAFLAERGLTTREACGDTVRNVVVCPFAGIARDEPFDVVPYADAIGRYLLRNPLGQGLPRKFKIAFEGCGSGDHVGLACHDVGVRAVRSDNGCPGFRVTLAGGLGALPQAGIPLEPFTPAGDLGDTILAVLRLFDRLGDRQRRGRARLKFVALSMGEDPFRQAVVDERRALGNASGRRLRLPEPAIRPSPCSHEGKKPPGWPGAFFQRGNGVVAVPLQVPLGDLAPEQLRLLAEIAEQADVTVRLTQAQGILVSDVPEDLAAVLAGKLREAGFRPPGDIALTRCAGTETCTVGTTRVRSLADLIEKEVLCYGDTDVSAGRGISMRISGCANGCGRHLLADIGLQGVARSVTGLGEGTGRLASHYMLFLGGGQDENGGVRFGTRVGRIPARRVIEAVKHVLAVLRHDAIPGERAGETISRLGVPTFTAALGDLLEPPPESFLEEDFLDLGTLGPVRFPHRPHGAAGSLIRFPDTISGGA